MAPLNIMQATVLFLVILVPAFKTAGAQPIGVCNGRNGDNLPSEQATVILYNANRIGRMRLYDPLQETLNALRGTSIEIILDVPNTKLESLQDQAAATAWVQENIINYVPGVNFRYISVGNEIDPDTGNSQYVNFVLPAMINVHNALVAAGQNQIKVSTATYSGLTGPDSSPPSHGSFKDNAKGFMEPIIRFLADNNSPLLANIYPSISYIQNPQENLQYALFTAPDVVVSDGDLEYKNLFDALLDVMYSAVEKSGGPNVEIVVSESGWPSQGSDRGASVENAQIYYQNLIDHVRGNNGTPKRPGKPIETYLFAMFDENIKTGDEIEKHFGLFNPITQQPKYQLNFS